MRALRLDKFGPPSELRVIDIDRPEPRDGEVLVRVMAAGVNPSDVKYAAGLVADSLLPRTPGRDYAGVVESGLPGKEGLEVWGTGGDLGITRDGTHAEYVVVPSGSISAKPEHLKFEEAAAVGVPYITAYKAVAELAGLQPNETILVIGGSGAVGCAARQIAKWIGANVLFSKRSTDRISCSDEEGAITGPSETLHERVLERTGGKGVQVVLNAVGGATFEPGVHSLTHGGRMVCISATGERRVSFDLVQFYKKEMRWFGLDTLELSTSDCAPYLEHLRPGFEHGAFSVSIGRTLPLESSAEAYELVANGGTGKVVLTMDSDV